MLNRHCADMPHMACAKVASSSLDKGRSSVPARRCLMSHAQASVPVKQRSWLLKRRCLRMHQTIMIATIWFAAVGLWELAQLSAKGVQGMACWLADGSLAKEAGCLGIACNPQSASHS